MRVWIRIGVVVCGLLGACVPSSAAAAPAVGVQTVSAAPATVLLGGAFTVRGRVAGRGRVQVRVVLRPAGRSRGGVVVGTRSVRVSRGRRGASFVVRARAPRQVAAAGRYRLVACVRVGGVTRGCRIARGVARLVAPSADGPLVTPNPAPPTPSAPAPGPAFPTFTSGARSIGDRLFPAIGNGGYDAQRYALALDYVPATKVLSGTATMTAVATQGLSDLSLDLQGLTVDAVTVDGAAATFRREATKLVVTPMAGIPAGATFAVAVTYHGVEAPIVDPDGSREGWVPTPDGATVLGEPIGAQGWFPCNNTPADKATYDLTVSVPDGKTVVGNGRLAGQSSSGGRTTWHWVEDEPMATYLATASVGDFDLTTDISTNAARPSYLAIDSGYSSAKKTQAAARQAEVPAMLAFYADRYGSYPFGTTGGVFDDTTVGYSLETQTRPTFPDVEPRSTVAHEHAHMWFGDSVTPTVWSDIWLNEGLTEFASWAYLASLPGGTSTADRFATEYASPSMTWDVRPAAPATASELFDSDAMYTRGAMVCEALRQILGDGAFGTLMRRWATDHFHANATTAQFVALAKEVGGVDPDRLDAFFGQWLYTSGRPTITPATF